ncbi:hypothetical protein RND81_11G052500 [Saponaria officinalis]|uniref:Uncharacterized protein n=1 Tax=Saponaria officinalis TaxID=3572 RepID=A0AAW1HH56_SAPOF
MECKIKAALRTTRINLRWLILLLRIKALEVAGQVVGTSVSTSPLPYSTMAGHCEALETSTRKKLSNWLSQENILSANSFELIGTAQTFTNKVSSPGDSW